MKCESVHVLVWAHTREKQARFPTTFERVRACNHLVGQSLVGLAVEYV